MTRTAKALGPGESGTVSVLSLQSLQLDAICRHMILQSASDVSSWFSNSHARHLLSIMWHSCKVLVHSLFTIGMTGFHKHFHAGDASVDEMRIGFLLSDFFVSCYAAIWNVRNLGRMFWKKILFLFQLQQWKQFFFSDR